MYTRIYHDTHHGWQAETDIDIGQGRVLRINTYRIKRDTNFLDTRVSVHTVGPNGSLTHILDYGTGGGDFSCVVKRSAPRRLSEKLVSAQHQAALDVIDRVKEMVDAHYAAHCEHGRALHHCVGQALANV